MQTEELTVKQANVDLNNAKRILTELKSERDDVKRKIEEAIQNDQIDLLSELDERIFELDEMELPLAQLLALEAGIRYWEVAMHAAQRVEKQRRAAFDGLFDARERSIAELRELIHDENREVATAQEKYLASQHEIQEIGDQLSLYQQRLRELQSQSDKTGIRQAQLGSLTVRYIALA
jgi:hypothetical protein